MSRDWRRFGLRTEQRLGRVQAWADQPKHRLGLTIAVILLAAVLRMPGAMDEEHYFRHHPDEGLYFNQAYNHFLSTAPPQPLAARGTGMSLLIEQELRLYGVKQGSLVATSNQPAKALDAGQLQAARVAYTFNAVAGVVLVSLVLLLARQFLSPLAALLAGLLAALDPFLIYSAGSLMTETLYTGLFILALAAAWAARKNGAWMLAIAVPMAAAHMLRVNGLVMFVIVVGLAFAFHLRERRTVPWMLTIASAALFFCLLIPYLAWRQKYLPGAFDYGTNQRFWADNLWDPTDNYWTHYTNKGGGPRETWRDYFDHHSARDALVRVYASVQLQVNDFIGAGSALSKDREGPVVQLGLVGFVVAGLAMLRRNAPRTMLLWSMLATFATFVWIYPLVRSPRYFGPLLPLVMIVAVAALIRIGGLVQRKGTLALLLLAWTAAMFAFLPLLDVPRAAMRMGDLWPLYLVGTFVSVILAATPEFFRLRASKTAS